ncbi:MAG: VOC family protein [Actinobacteria bacterium]|nr:VOC family protein [Actinomycetota bacterium]
MAFSHLSLTVTDLQRSVPFYERYASLRVLGRRKSATHADTVSLTDGEGTFVLVLAQNPNYVARLEGRAHLGMSCASTDDVDQMVQQAMDAGVMTSGVRQDPEPIGYHAFFVDPDGHQLELAYSQGFMKAAAAG